MSKGEEHQISTFKEQFCISLDCTAVAMECNVKHFPPVFSRLVYK